MPHISTVIIGAGQAGLAMSKCLTDRSVPHVVIERGRVANSWATQRWNSLRLLTPNWQSRLPGYSYTGADPDGYMSMPQVTGYLRDYAQTFSAPVEERTTVLSVTADGVGYQVETDRGSWTCNALVLATGACAQARVPAFGRDLPQEVAQLTSQSYRAPEQVAPGGVLVVGASASGTQIAAELLAADREVILCAGAHIRMPRRHRGRDVHWWMDRTGLLDMGVTEVDDIARARRAPSLQLVGHTDQAFLDLNRVQDLGAQIVGRWMGVKHGTAQFSGALANLCALSDLKMRRLLTSFDTWADTHGLDGLPPPIDHGSTRVPPNPELSLDLTKGRIRTVIWATGSRPDFGFARLPIFDRSGAVQQVRGHAGPGLYVLGMPFQSRRKSTLIDGVGQDAEDLATHLVEHQRHRAA